MRHATDLRDFNLSKLKKFRTDIITDFIPEKSPLNYSPGSVNSLNNIAAQHKDMLNAYLYAQDSILKWIASNGIQQITEKLILEWINNIHRLIMNGLNHEYHYQSYGLSTPSNLLPPQTEATETKMTAFAKDIAKAWRACNAEDREAIVEFTALVFFQFNKIRPFARGNSRAATCLINIILVAFGLSSILFCSKEDNNNQAINKMANDLNLLTQHLHARLDAAKEPPSNSREQLITAQVQLASELQQILIVQHNYNVDQLLQQAMNPIEFSDTSMLLCQDKDLVNAIRLERSVIIVRRNRLLSAPSKENKLTRYGKKKLRALNDLARTYLERFQHTDQSLSINFPVFIEQIRNAFVQLSTLKKEVAPGGTPPLVPEAIQYYKTHTTLRLILDAALEGRAYTPAKANVDIIKPACNVKTYNEAQMEGTSTKMRHKL